MQRKTYVLSILSYISCTYKFSYYCLIFIPIFNYNISGDYMKLYSSTCLQKGPFYTQLGEAKRHCEKNKQCVGMANSLCRYENAYRLNMVLLFGSLDRNNEILSTKVGKLCINFIKICYLRPSKHDINKNNSFTVYFLTI